MQSVLDVIVNPAGAQSGAKAVNAALHSMNSGAKTAMNEFTARTGTMRNAIFSLQGAVAGIGIGILARSLTQMGRELDLTERSLRAVTGSAGGARVELLRLREIADNFQLPDREMANAFRLLASNNIPKAEEALKSIANVAAQTGVDVGTVTTAMLAGQERMLRQLGVQLIDLGTGEIDLVFGNMEIRAKKTDDAIRRGLLQLFKHGFPDATKDLSGSIDFQLKRVLDVWDDFEANIMLGGLNDFLASAFRTFADGFTNEEIKAAGENAAKSIQNVLEMVGRDIAATIDLLQPFASVAFSILENAGNFWNKLPPAVQAIGIFGALFFGLQGTALLIGGLALAEKLGLKWEDIQRQINNTIGATPLGAAARMAANVTNGEPAITRPPELTPDTWYLGVGSSFRKPFPDAGKGTVLQNPPDPFNFKQQDPGSGVLAPLGGIEGVKQAQTALEKFDAVLDKIHARQFQLKREREIGIVQSKEAEMDGAVSAFKKADDNQRKILAQINQLKEQHLDLLDQEIEKQDILYSPELLEARKAGLQFIQSMEQRGLDLDKASRDTGIDLKGVIMSLFAAQGDLNESTRIFNERLELKNQLIAKGNDLQRDATRAAQDSQLDVDILTVPLGQARREAELNGKLMLQIERDRLNIGGAQLENLKAQNRIIAENEQKAKNMVAAEQQRLQHLERIGALEDQSRDLNLEGGLFGPGGQTAPSLQSRLNAARRQAQSQGLGFDAVTTEAQIRKEMKAEAQVAQDQRLFAMDNETELLRQQLHLVGKSRREREEELRVIQAINDAKLAGQPLDEDQIDDVRKRSKDLQDMKEFDRMGDAMNSFVDSMEVGWDTIARSGTQAMSHLEDALTSFIMTGKLDFGTFAQFIQTEMIRMAIRFLMWKAILGIGQAVAGMAGGAAAGAAGGAAGGGNAVDFNSFTGGDQRGGIVARGQNYPVGRGYYDVPGYQQGGINFNERLLRISEGHTPEAIIPLRGGKVPVEMRGGGAMIHAPITIITPDASGIRKSASQVEAELSGRLQRAAKRNT